MWIKDKHTKHFNVNFSMVLEECLGVWSGGEGGEMDPLQGCCAWKHFTALNPYVAGHGCKKLWNWDDKWIMCDMYEKLRAKIAMMKNEIYCKRMRMRLRMRMRMRLHPFQLAGILAGTFNTLFKFIMTFYSLCSRQKTERGGIKKEGIKQPNFQRVLFKVFAHFSVENAIN